MTLNDSSVKNLEMFHMTDWEVRQEAQQFLAHGVATFTVKRTSMETKLSNYNQFKSSAVPDNVVVWDYQ